MLSCTLYGLYFIVATGFDELYPLQLATAIEYGNKHNNNNKKQYNNA